VILEQPTVIFSLAHRYILLLDIFNNFRVNLKRQREAKITLGERRCQCAMPALMSLCVFAATPTTIIAGEPNQPRHEFEGGLT